MRKKKKKCIENKLLFPQNEAFSKPSQFSETLYLGCCDPSSLCLFAAHIYCIEDVDLCTFLHSCSAGVVPSSSVVVSFSVGNYNKAFPQTAPLTVVLCALKQQQCERPLVFEWGHWVQELPWIHWWPLQINLEHYFKTQAAAEIRKTLVTSATTCSIAIVCPKMSCSNKLLD